MLIAEIGNNHFGNLKKFKEMIFIANECGADVIKGQAFLAEDITHCSMDIEFYKMCSLTLSECFELIEYARDIGNDLFFTLFNDNFDILSTFQEWIKIPGEFYERNPLFSLKYDFLNTFVSIRKNLWIAPFQHATPLYVSDYLEKEPDLKQIDRIRETLRTDVGYSDHSEGTKSCIDAIVYHQAKHIEKHFTLEKNIKFKGVVYRDTIHGATPKQLEDIANAMYNLRLN